MSLSSNNHLPKVELHSAHVFDCRDCGHENFIRSVSENLTEDEIVELMRKHGEDAEYWSSGCCTSRPTEVTCEYCSAVFETVDWESGDEYVSEDEEDE